MWWQSLRTARENPLWELWCRFVLEFDATWCDLVQGVMVAQTRMNTSDLRFYSTLCDAVQMGKKADSKTAGGATGPFRTFAE
jgi:hypothetical protein